MSPAGMLILLIVAIGTAAVGVVVYEQVISTTQQAVHTPTQTSTIQIVSAGVHNITDNTAGHVRIAVTATRPVRINDTLIVLHTADDVAYLQYRNGSLERNQTNGYYTQ